MADVAHFDIGADLMRLLQELLQTWPAEADLNYIHVYLDHEEYEEALENLIAVGLRGAGFTPDQIRRVTGLATSMGVELAHAASVARRLWAAGANTRIGLGTHSHPM